ncbi:hypothetical protein B0J13DRAFT_424098, partial [Dactylonectria estremocensis]
YRDRLRVEMRERRLATTRCHMLSETADVFDILIRAPHDSHQLRKLLDFSPSHLVVCAYLLSKYTLRWQFCRVAALLCNRAHLNSMREVVNPAKDHKLYTVARRHGIEPEGFELVCRRLR